MKCPYYNQGLFIGSTPQGSTQISMCCWQQKQTVDSVSFDHEYLQEVRQQSQHQIPNNCSKFCSIPGHVANERERSLIEWPILIDTDIDKQVIRVLHLEQGLICNLKCISCSTKYSSAWNGEYQEFVPSAPTISLSKVPEEQWKHLDLTYLRKVHFTGGEPLLNRDNKKILQHLDSLGILSEVSVSYNTNGTIKPDDELLELWQRCKFIRLFVSLDGVRSTFEYTRFPANWEEVKSNINYIRSLSHIAILIEVDAIVGIHNIFDLPEFFAWWENECQAGSQGDPSCVFVRKIDQISFGGQVLDLKYLSNTLAESALDMLNTLTKYDGVGDLIRYIKNNREPGFQWVDYLYKLDKQRKTNWQQSLNAKLLLL